LEHHEPGVEVGGGGHVDANHFVGIFAIQVAAHVCGDVFGRDGGDEACHPAALGGVFDQHHFAERHAAGADHGFEHLFDRAVDGADDGGAVEDVLPQAQ